MLDQLLPRFSQLSCGLCLTAALAVPSMAQVAAEAEKTEEAPDTEQLERSQWDSASDRRMLQKLKETFGDPKGMVRLDPVSRVWADRKKKRVVTDGFVALREGQLEMLACLVGTKEHESVVAVFTKAQFIHAGLLAIGAKKGTPVKWRPEYQPPTGSKIRVVVLWRDKDGKKHASDARKWVRENKSGGGHLDVDFVFAGSIFAKDPDTGKEVYEAEAGDLVCVANFSTATLDIPIRSLDANSMLSYVAYTDRIPPSGTPVRLVFELVDESKDAKNKPADTADAETKKGAANTAAAPSTFSLAGYERLLNAPGEEEAASAQETLPPKTAGGAPANK
ncbi:MAG: hypothetical protein Aurels2KO_05010 [Aureliella sp.]